MVSQGDLPLVALYADESCIGNGRDGENPGGAGVLLEYLRPGAFAVARPLRRDLWVSEPATTNNRMALRSVIEPFRALARKGRRFRVIFVTDSRYIVDGMTRWVHDWARRGWARRGGSVENLALWIEAVRVASQHLVEWRWVRGHAGHAQNEYANYLAMSAAANLSNSNGFLPSHFDEWLERRASQGHPLQLHPFPETFSPAPPLPKPPHPRP
jgi:ribonuclease HI